MKREVAEGDRATSCSRRRICWRWFSMTEQTESDPQTKLHRVHSFLLPAQQKFLCISATVELFKDSLGVSDGERGFTPDTLQHHILNQAEPRNRRYLVW
ncbi:hypothetical protein INR49_002727 [Caranx melampygus]|nr:hypothetical protein INR49_002727 [Caranx melampygus]